MAQTTQTTEKTRSAVRLALFKGLGEGYLLAFLGTGQPSSEASQALDEATQALAALNPWQRFWVPQLQAWWVADEAITLLAKRVPAVADALDQWLHRPLDASTFTSAYFNNFTENATTLNWEALLRSLGRSAVPPTASATGAAVPTLPMLPARIIAAYYRLGLQPGATEQQVRAARRRLARKHHPDAGGDAAAMIAINTAADAILKWLRNRP